MTTPRLIESDVQLAEEAVAGAAMLGAEAVDAITELLSHDDFVWPHCRAVLEAAEQLRSEGRLINPETVFLRIRENGRAEDLGWLFGHQAHEIARLFEATGSGSEIYEFAPAVRNASIRRRLTATLTAAAASLQRNDTGSPLDVLASVEQQLFEIGASETARRSGEIRELRKAAFEIVQQIDKPKDSTPYIPSGFEALDNLIGGFRPGRLYILAARPGVGKSALALAFSLNIAAAGSPALLFSLEMGIEEIAERAVAIRSGVSLSRITGTVTLNGGECTDIANMPEIGSVWVDDRAELTVAKMASTTRRAVRSKNARIVVLDYLQLLTSENPRDARYLQVGQDTRRLKQLARQCNVPVICLCQLNRESENRKDQRPILSDLRDSGEIEQNADAVLLLWRDKSSDAGPRQTIRVDVAKQRNGPTGEFTLTYRRPCVRFEPHYWP